ncbi:FAD:protein FMN transferase [Angustibacter peucedani]
MLATRRPQQSRLESWGVLGDVVVDDPAALAPATQIARRHLDALARAAHRALPQAEVHRLPCAAGEPVAVSPLLARVIGAALKSAARTDGLVDPTVATPRRAAGRPGQQAKGWLPVCGSSGDARPVIGWQRVRLDGSRVSVPGGTTLDLRASALAVGLDDVALVAAQLTGADVVVRLGGRTARLGHGQVATDPRHVVDPRTGRPAPSTWSLVEVSAPTCRRAGELAVDAAVLGAHAADWLEQRGADARLTAADGSVVRVGRFEPVPARAPQAA